MMINTASAWPSVLKFSVLLMSSCISNQQSNQHQCQAFSLSHKCFYQLLHTHTHTLQHVNLENKGLGDQKGKDNSYSADSRVFLSLTTRLQDEVLPSPARLNKNHCKARSSGLWNVVPTGQPCLPCADSLLHLVQPLSMWRWRGMNPALQLVGRQNHQYTI